MLRFAAITGLLTLAVLAMLIMSAHQGWFAMPSFSYETLTFFALSNLVIYWLTARNLKDHPEDFVRVYLGTTVLRILFFGVFIFTVIFLDRSGATKNTLFFLACYFLFTTIEVTALWLKIRR